MTLSFLKFIGVILLVATMPMVITALLNMGSTLMIWCALAYMVGVIYVVYLFLKNLNKES